MKKYLLLFVLVAASAFFLATPTGLAVAAEQKNNPGVFDSGGTAKSMANIGLAFGRGALIRNITGHASSEGRMHSRGIGFGAGFGVADTVFDCAVATKCTAKQFFMDSVVAALTGGARGYAISEIGGDAPWLWAGLVESGWEFADEFGVNRAVYTK